MKKNPLFCSLKTELIGIDTVESFTTVEERLQPDMKNVVSITMKSSPTMLEVWIY